MSKIIVRKISSEIVSLTYSHKMIKGFTEIKGIKEFKKVYPNLIKSGWKIIKEN